MRHLTWILRLRLSFEQVTSCLHKHALHTAWAKPLMVLATLGLQGHAACHPHIKLLQLQPISLLPPTTADTVDVAGTTSAAMRTQQDIIEHYGLGRYSC